MAAEGHEERFPPSRLSAGCGFRKETTAGMRGNGRDAPKAVIRTTASPDVEVDAMLEAKQPTGQCWLHFRAVRSAAGRERYGSYSRAFSSLLEH